MTESANEKCNYILTATCRAGTGVVAAVAGYLANRDCYICALEQFDDESTDKFFMRAVFRPQGASPPIDEIREGFSEVADKKPTEKQWQIIQDHLALVFNKVTPNRKEPEAPAYEEDRQPDEGTGFFP